MSRKNKRRNNTNYQKHLHKIWVKSDKRGIAVVEKYGFREKRILNAPNEMHIEAFMRWVKLVCNKLGLKIPHNPERYS